jgi:hypothetical protein
MIWFALIVSVFLEILYIILKYFLQMVLDYTMSRSGGNTGFFIWANKKKIYVDHAMIIFFTFPLGSILNNAL